MEIKSRLTLDVVVGQKPSGNASGCRGRAAANDLTRLFGNTRLQASTNLVNSASWNERFGIHTHFAKSGTKVGLKGINLIPAPVE